MNDWESDFDLSLFPQLAPYVTDYFPESFETVGEYVRHFYGLYKSLG